MGNAAKRKNLRALNDCRRITKVREKKREVFAAVAWRLGVEWNGTADHGYELCFRLLREEQPPPRVKRADLPAVATDAFLSSFAWRRLRMEVLVERGARCECCGANPKTDEHVRINVDHVKPRKLFPSLALDKSNLQVLCNVCNHGKGNWDQTDWRAKEDIA